MLSSHAKVVGNIEIWKSEKENRHNIGATHKLMLILREGKMFGIFRIQAWPLNTWYFDRLLQEQLGYKQQAALTFLLESVFPLYFESLPLHVQRRSGEQGVVLDGVLQLHIIHITLQDMTKQAWQQSPQGAHVLKEFVAYHD